MAYQPKSYRKFIAGAATAAVVASSFAGVAGAASLSFTDVNDNYKEAVDYLVSKGIKGISETEFGTYNNIKRVDAAVFVVKALGLDVDAAPASGFTDVPERAVKEVNALKAAGITSGKSATSFGAQDLITRGELAIWLDRAFNLEGEGDVSKFNDATGIYTEAIKALVANNITQGTSATTFGTKDNAKRGDFAIFVKRASEAVSEAAVKSVTAENGKVTVQLTKAPEATPVAADFKLTQSVDGSAASDVTPAGFAWDADSNTATFTVSPVGASTKARSVSYSVAFKDTAAKSASFTVAAVNELTVASVKPLNALEIEVKFNTTVKEDVAETAAYYLVKPAGSATPLVIDEVELQDDKQTVIIKLATAAKLDDKSYYTVEVPKNNVWSVEGQVQESDYKTTFQFVDSALATLGDVKYNNIQEAQVEFSKPMSTLATTAIKIYNKDGEVVTGEAAVKEPAAGAAISNGTKKLVIDLANAVVDKEYTVKVFGATDISGNVLPTQTFTVKKAAKTDDTKPTLTNVEVLANNKLKLTFSEKVVKDSTGKYGVLTLPAGNINLINSDTNLAEDLKVSEDGKEITVTVKSTHALVTGLRTVSVNNFYDFSLNQQTTAQSKVVNVIEAEPKVSTVTVGNYQGNDAVLVKFDQEVRVVTPAAAVFSDIKYYENSIEKTPGGSTFTTNYAVLYDPDGNGKSDTIAVYVDPAVVKEAQYSVDLNANVVTDIYGNLNKSKSDISFTYDKVGAISKPAVDDDGNVNNGITNNYTAQADGTENEIKITFNKEVTAATALNVNNYLIDGTVAVEKAAFVGDAKTVRLTLKPGVIKETSTYAFTIKNVADANGNVMDAVTFAQGFTENVAPEIEKAELTTPGTIKVTTTENLSGVSAADFELYIGGAKVANPFDGTTPVTFTAGQDTFTLNLASVLTQADLGKTIEIKVVKDTATEDNSAIQNNLKGEVTVTVQK